ncbi:unnamed protein product [Mytilus edulis]|uniref:Uncharacterized protein n=1 Tax=Mytilus edulis TaxID=6550 RepID=A0A8S3VAU0_MYTED|nr:unnamed protein product [Mytilus edulis]
MDKYSTEIGIMKKYASDLQTFLGMTTIKSKIIDNEKCLQSMIENKSLEHTGGYLFTDYCDPNDRLIAFDIEGKTDYIIQLSVQYSTFDVELLDENTVAVTTGKKIKNRQRIGISIVDLQTRKVIEFIPLPMGPYGITYDGKSLICCVQHQDLRLISCTNYSITTIPNTALPTNSYVSTHADKIYFTNPEKHKVSCCLYNGTPGGSLRRKLF